MKSLMSKMAYRRGDRRVPRRVVHRIPRKVARWKGTCSSVVGLGERRGERRERLGKGGWGKKDRKENSSRDALVRKTISQEG